MARLAWRHRATWAATLGVAVKDAGALRDEVIRKGIGYAPRRGMIDFTIPLFDAYLRRQGELVAAAPGAAGALAAGSAMEMKSLTVCGRYTEISSRYSGFARPSMISSVFGGYLPSGVDRLEQLSAALLPGLALVGADEIGCVLQDV